MSSNDPRLESADPKRLAERALRKLGYSKIAPEAPKSGPAPAFWVQEAGVPRRTFPVFVDGGQPGGTPGWEPATKGGSSRLDRAILVVPSDVAAEKAWSHLATGGAARIDAELAILVVPPGPEESAPHWHARVVERSEILRLATGIVVGLFQRAQGPEGSPQIDFEEMLGLLRTRFGIDVQRSLGVKSDEDALFMIYQMALRHSYAPGDPGTNLHMLVLKPTGPAARLPWFAA